MTILDRRLALLGGLAGLSACATNPQRLAAPDASRLMPVRAHMRRVFDITVCSRPFRAAGPRLDTEMLGDTLVVHNYGHGGSGWSLSWGSAQLVLEKALQRGDKNLAVIGCGALGLTTAVLALKMGCSVALYAKELLPLTRSARATGSWTPDSRIALRDSAAPGLGELWERMARFTWKSYRGYVGLPGKPVECGDRYYITDGSGQNYYTTPNALAFAQYSNRIADIIPSGVDMPPGSTPFQLPNVRRTENMQFNVASYGHTLMAEFYAMGGKLEVREFHEPSEFTRLKQKVVINCTGYGARALWKDESLIPVRGQIAWLAPQPEVNYGVNYRGVQMIPRSDGIVVQMLEGGDMRGYNQDNETVDRAEAAEGISRIAELYTRFK